MPIKLNSFKLKDETVNLMEDLLEKTKQTKFEHGFDLCLIPIKKELIARNVCVGDSCEVEMKGKCEKGEILKGGYHTHRAALSSRPSLHDLMIGLKLGIECLGSARDNTIKCYVKRNNPPESINNRAMDLINKFDNKTLTEKEFEEFMRLEDRIRNTYFDIINVK